VQEQSSSDAATPNLLTGLGVDQTFSRSLVGGATSSLLIDALGSTIALADASGTVQATYTYEPFGAVTQTGAANTNPFRFTGREDDGATGLYSCQARYYAPALSRFISEDPLGYPGGPDPNLYPYVGNAPTMLVDPFGLDPGGGCGFLGFGCVVDAFGRLLTSGSHFIVSNRHVLAALWCVVPGVGLSTCAVAAGVVLAWDVGVNWSAAQGSAAEKITSWAFWRPTLINATQTGAALVPGLAAGVAARQGVATAWQLYAAQAVAGSPAVVLGACLDIEAYACLDIEAYGCRPTS
jgi:RHS repeat-associated protein